MTKLSFWNRKPKTGEGLSGARKKPGALRRLYQRAILDAFIKLDPRWMIHNPVMFVTENGQLADNSPLDSGTAGTRRSSGGIHRRCSPLAVALCIVRQLFRSAGRRAWKAQAAAFAVHVKKPTLKSSLNRIVIVDVRQFLLVT